MDCPWYLGFQATEECLKTCTITEENRDYSICPESTSEDDAYTRPHAHMTHVYTRARGK